MAEQKTYSIKIDGIEQSVKGVESLGSAVGSNASSMKELRKALKAVQDEMAGLDKNSEQWKKLAKVAGEYQDKMDDIRQATRRFASDTKALDDAINIGQSMTSVFTLAKGAMSAFGLETEGAVESIQKLQGAMAIIQSLQSLQNTLKGSSATATLYTKAMNLLAMAMGKGSTASKALRGAMLAIPLMLVITAVTELVMHWDELVGWFTKTFPALKNLSTWFNKVSGAVAGLGNAVWAAIKNLGMIPELLQAIFTGNFEKAIDIYKKALNNIVNGFKTGYADKMADIQEEVTLKEVEENNKRTKHQLEMLKAQKGNAAKYSKEGIELQKKDFEERKKLAKGNKDELNKIAVEEASFYRECQEQKSAAAKKAAADAKKSAKERAEAEKKAAEEAKKAAEKLKRLNDELHKERLKTDDLILESNEIDLNEIKRRLQLQINEEKNLEKKKELYDDLKAVEIEIINLQKSHNEAKIFEEVNEKLGGVFKNFDEFKAEIEGTSDKVTGFSQTELTYFNNAVLQMENEAKRAKNAINSINDEEELKIKEKLANAVRKSDEADYKIEKAALELAIEEAKTDKEKIYLKNKLIDLEAEHEKYLLKLSAMDELGVSEEEFDQMLSGVKVLTDYQAQVISNMQKGVEVINLGVKIQKKSTETKRDDGNPFKDLYGEDEGGIGVDWDKVSERIEQAYDAFAAPIVEGLGDSIHMMLEFAIEEAENALAEAEALHDEAVSKVEESKDRISEINDKMKESSGAQLEQYKQQMADEVLLLQQREQEEKRLQKEKEKREKELEKQKKKQRKLELQQQLIQAIVSGALAVVNGLATQPFVPVGIAMGALAGVATAIQIATITKQMSKLADGGLLQGRSHAQGGIAVGNTGIEVEGGEYVVNKRSTAKYLPLLQQINEEGARKKTVANQLGKMADGGQLNYERINSNMDALNTAKIVSAAIEGIEMHPVVSVIDINRGQKNLTEVRQLAGANS